MRSIRLMLGKLVILFEKVFSPKSMHRSSEEQEKVDAATSKFVLYQFAECPFCLKVRLKVKSLGLNIEMRDTLRNETYLQELLKGGGKDQAPCLRIEEGPGKFSWLYESSDINDFLDKQFGSH